MIKVDYELLKCNCQFGHTKYDTNNQKIFSIGDALRYTYPEEFFYRDIKYFVRFAIIKSRKM